MTPPKIGMFVAFCLLACWATVASGEMMPGAIGNDGANGFDGSISAFAYTSIGSNGRVPAAAVNGAGLAADGLHSAPSWGYNVAWESASGDTAGYFVADLGEAYALDYLKFWNFQYSNDGGTILTSRGVQSADIYVSTVDTPSNYDFANNSQWTLLIDDQVLAQAPGTTTNDYSQQINLSGTSAQWVAFDILSNYGDLGYTGINEIQFFEAVPEPSTWLLSLFAIGAALIAVRRR